MISRYNVLIVSLLCMFGMRAEQDNAHDTRMPQPKEVQLLIAADTGCFECVRDLLQHQPLDTEYFDSDTGHNALMLAARNGHTDIIQLLLDKTELAKIINAKDAWGDTALHLATRNGRTDAVRLLLDYGANRNVRNNRGDRPIDIIRHLRGYSTENPITYYARKFAAWMQDRQLPEEKIPKQYRIIEQLLS